MNPPELPPENVYSPPASWGEPPPYQFPVLPPAWPKVIGISAIVLASYGLLANGAGIFTSRMMRTMLSGGAMAKVGFTPDTVAAMERFTMFNAIGGLVLAALLLTAGIGLVRRRPLSRPLMLGWAILRLGLAAVAAPMMFDYMNSMMGSIAASPTASAPAPPVRVVPSPTPGPEAEGTALPAPPPASAPAASPVSPALMAGFSSGMAMISVVMGTAMVCLLPGFVLIWFNLRKVKAYIATWPPGTGNGPAAAG